MKFILATLITLIALHNQASAANENQNCQQLISRSVYSDNPADIKRAEDLTALIADNLVCKNINIRDITNEVAKANQHGNKAPYRWTTDTIIYHRNANGECPVGFMQQLPDQLKTKDIVFRCLPDNRLNTPGAIEIWVKDSTTPTFSIKLKNN